MAKEIQLVFLSRVTVPDLIRRKVSSLVPTYENKIPVNPARISLVLEGGNENSCQMYYATWLSLFPVPRGEHISYDFIITSQ